MFDFDLSNDFLYFNATQFCNLKHFSLANFLETSLVRTVIDHLRDDCNQRPLYYQYDEETQLEELYLRHELISLFDDDKLSRDLEEYMIQQAAELIGVKFNYLSNLDSSRTANTKVDVAKYDFLQAKRKHQILCCVFDKIQNAETLTDNIIELLQQVNISVMRRQQHDDQSFLSRFYSRIRDNSNNIEDAREQLIAKIVACSYEIQIRANFLKVLLAQLLVREMRVRAATYYNRKSAEQTYLNLQ